MKSFIPNPLVLLSLICSILFFTSCSKDSDLLLSQVLLDSEETVPIEDANSENAGGSDEERGSDARKGDGVNLILNGTFENSDEWVLINGSTINNGVLNITAGGDLGTNENYWSGRYNHILNTHYYATRRFRFTFDARQTSGSGNFQIGQRHSVSFDQAITGSWATYTVEADGNAPNASNFIVIGGATAGDTFEVDNFKMEIIGDTSNPNVPGKPAQITMFTDFEPNTYSYSQFGPNGQHPPEFNQWEVDQGDPRTTATSGSPLTTGRDGTGRAVWLGDYNNNISRNELSKDIALPLGEHWIAFSFYPQNSLPDSRLLMQTRNLAANSSNTVNAISLRYDEDTDRMYFSICTDVNSVDQTKESLGRWNGAGTGTESVFFDYNYRGWNDVVIHYKGAFGANYTGPDTSILDLDKNFGYDPRSDGFIEIWVNGTKVVDHVGTTIFRYEKHGGQIRWGISPKIGPYWADYNSPQGDVYYDNYSIWVGPNGTYDDVDPSK